TEFGVHDTLRHGLRSVRSEVVPSHPLEKVLDQWDDTQEQLRYSMHRRAFGSHLPIRLQMEKALVSQVRRIPVLPVSNVGLDILTGRDGHIEFEDFLGDAKMPTDMIDPHAAMEHSLGMGTL
ncbi:proteasome maturation factor UMP1, partial [Blyttiomyces helicus]